VGKIRRLIDAWRERCEQAKRGRKRKAQSKRCMYCPMRVECNLIKVQSHWHEESLMLPCERD